MASKRRNMFQKNKTQETTENGEGYVDTNDELEERAPRRRDKQDPISATCRDSYISATVDFHLSLFSQRCPLSYSVVRFGKNHLGFNAYYDNPRISMWLERLRVITVQLSMFYENEKQETTEIEATNRWHSLAELLTERVTRNAVSSACEDRGLIPVVGTEGSESKASAIFRDIGIIVDSAVDFVLDGQHSAF
ncbi:hypothetical protein AAG570_004102 [Ranatra chinensis]|uniref:Uncharacterized protein n=1 Tax=Ranatra chinensis TaxID=642074 RepID=A0ABD0Y2T1_9HEMI